MMRAALLNIEEPLQWSRHHLISFVVPCRANAAKCNVWEQQEIGNPALEVSLVSVGCVIVEQGYLHGNTATLNLRFDS